MLFTEFTVESFRNFSEKQSLILAKPENDKTGSGLTYIVGENNTGKTSLLEAMRKEGKAFQAINNYIEKTDKKSDSVCFVLKGKTESLKEAVRTVRLKEGSLYELSEEWLGIEEYDNITPPVPYFIPSRRSWSPIV